MGFSESLGVTTKTVSPSNLTIGENLCLMSNNTMSEINFEKDKQEYKSYKDQQVNQIPSNENVKVLILEDQIQSKERDIKLLTDKLALMEQQNKNLEDTVKEITERFDYQLRHETALQVECSQLQQRCMEVEKDNQQLKHEREDLKKQLDISNQERTKLLHDAKTNESKSQKREAYLNGLER